jgi:hypothetical protein
MAIPSYYFLDWSDWHPLRHLPAHLRESERGVYVIAHPTNVVVRVGQGNIRDRLVDHADNPSILAATDYDGKVTWAPVRAGLLNIVEGFLADQLSPLLGDRYPDPPVSNFAANLPEGVFPGSRTLLDVLTRPPDWPHSNPLLRLIRQSS